MKTNRTDELPAMNLLRPEGVQDQTDNKIITKVFLTNGQMFNVVPGSFHIYVTSGDRPQPYVQFQALDYPNDEANDRVVHTIEIFPASMAGVAFLPVEKADDE